MSFKRIAVIGAGISGLSFANRLYELTKNDKTPPEIVLFEAQNRAGGIIETETRDGYLLEKGPDSFLSEKPAALELSKRLGLGSELINTKIENRQMFIARGKRLIPVPQGFYLLAPTDVNSFLKSALFSPLEKMRILYEMRIQPRRGDTDESIASFIRRRFGKACLEKVGQAMIGGVYTGDPENLSLKATMPRFIEFEKSHGSVIKALLDEKKKKDSVKDAAGPRYSLFLSYKKGMQTLTDTLTRRLPAGVLQLESAVEKVYFDAMNRKWVIVLRDGQMRAADILVISLSASEAGRLLSAHHAETASALSKIKSESVATLNLAYDKKDITHPLNGFGFVVPKIEKRSLIACTFVNQKYERRAPEGKVLLRAFIGGAFGKETLAKTDEEIICLAGQDLKELLGITAAPHFSVLKRYKDSMVQYQIGHEARLASIQDSMKALNDLYLIGASYRGVGIPDCIREAEETAENMIENSLNEERAYR